MAQQEESATTILIGTILGTILKYGLLGGVVGILWGWAVGFNLWMSAMVVAGISATVLSFMSLSIAIQKSEQRRREFAFARDMMFTPLFFLAAAAGLVVGLITQVIL